MQDSVGSGSFTWEQVAEHDDDERRVIPSSSESRNTPPVIRTAKLYFLADAYDLRDILGQALSDWRA